jgi:Protein of unknown function (DUF3667)
LSHFKERVEKVCLNCGAEVQGRYCHTCGQENIEPRESVWHLVMHFFYDITHFDGKFFSTSKLLFFKPGFLSREYMVGRRASYLNPIRMYIFTSAFFFLLFFSFFFKIDEEKIGATQKDIDEIGKQLGDSGNINLNNLSGVLTIDGDTIGNIFENDLSYRMFRDSLRNAYERKTTRQDSAKKVPSTKADSWGETNYEKRNAYDSAQKLLPNDQRDGWFEKAMIYRNIEIKEKYGGNTVLFVARMMNKFLHQLPTLMFVSLPLFALILKLLYVRRKQFYYVNHLIFSIHFYIFSFLMMLLFFGFGELDKYLPTVIWDILQIIAWVLIFIYLYKAMRNFYQQRRVKTIVKFLTLNFLSLLVSIILFSIFALYTAMYA